MSSQATLLSQSSRPLESSAAQSSLRTSCQNAGMNPVGSNSPAQASASPSAGSRFSRPRFALLVLIGVYPLITAILYAVAPLTEGWQLWQRTLVIAPIMVTIMIWGLIPGVQKRFHRFLNPLAS